MRSSTSLEPPEATLGGSRSTDRAVADTNACDVEHVLPLRKRQRAGWRVATTTLLAVTTCGCSLDTRIRFGSRGGASIATDGPGGLCDIEERYLSRTCAAPKCRACRRGRRFFPPNPSSASCTGPTNSRPPRNIVKMPIGAVAHEQNARWSVGVMALAPGVGAGSVFARGPEQHSRPPFPMPFPFHAKRPRGEPPRM